MSKEQDVTYVAISHRKRHGSPTDYTIIHNGVSTVHKTPFKSFIFPFITPVENGDSVVWNIIYSEYEGPVLLTGAGTVRDFTDNELDYINDTIDLSLLRVGLDEGSFRYDGIEFNELYVRGQLIIVRADEDLYIYTRENGLINRTHTYYGSSDRMHPHAYIEYADQRYLLTSNSDGEVIIGFDSQTEGDDLEESKEYFYFNVKTKSMTKEYGLILSSDAEYVMLRDPSNPQSVHGLFDMPDDSEEVSQTVFFTGDDNQTYVVCNYRPYNSPIIKIGRFMGFGQPAEFIQTIGENISSPQLIAHPRGVIIKADNDYSKRYTIYEVGLSGIVETSFDPIFPLEADHLESNDVLKIGIDGKYAFADIFNVP